MACNYHRICRICQVPAGGEKSLLATCLLFVPIHTIIVCLASMPIQQIIERAVTYLPTINRERILRAYDFAKEAHEGQTRFSGEPYIIHPLGVTEILLDFHPDEASIIAALLHDVAEDTKKTLEDIESVFGKEVRDLCWGMVKLSKVRSKLNDPQIENLRKLFLAMAKDYRVVLLKLCDRLHNMGTLHPVRPEKRIRISQETLNIYAPIAARLGIYRLKSQLEDLCFKYLHEEEYTNIQQQLQKTCKWRDKYIETARNILTEILAKEGIQALVDGRVKSAYSIYRKLKKKGRSSIDDIFDVFAMRIILPDIHKYDKEYTGHLYTALGVVHNHFTPLANRFKDYVAVPKVNGYRSLHTTVMGLGPKIYTQPTEVQIRTNTMHDGAEFGIAAHWLYEEGTEINAQHLTRATQDEGDSGSNVPFASNQKDWIVGLEKIEKEISSNQELLENLQVDVFQDRIFVLTPRGDVKDLPAHATPIDFAYAVHTQIGDHCIAAKVNGNMVPVDYELKSGEVVDIVTRKNAQPSQHWLSFVKTNHARNRIRAWFNDLDESKHLRAGKDLLNQKLRQLGKPLLDVDMSILREYEGKRLTKVERYELLVGIGKGVTMPGTVIRKIFTVDELLGIGARDRSVEALPSVKEAANKDGDVNGKKELPELAIGNETNMPYHFVQCCNAGYADELIGYVTRGRGVSVHRKDCEVAKNTETGRLVSVNVPNKKSQKYPVKLRISVEDRVGLVRDISHVVAENGVNITDMARVDGKDKTKLTDLEFAVEIADVDQLEKLLYKLEKIPSVRRAYKVN